jgi:hypothetical protein
VTPPDFDTTLAFLKALANEQRLRIVGLLMERQRSVQELATLLQLKEPTVCHHLAVLNKVALLDMTADGNTHWYKVRDSRILAISRSVFGKEGIEIDPGVDEKRWDKRVLENFVVQGQLTQIPASRKKRWIVLRWLAEKFKLGEEYSEASVNKIIQRHHWDSATLRRELIGYRMLKRQKGVYWRQPESAWLQA